MKILFIVLLMFATTGVAEMKLTDKLDMLHTVALVTVTSSNGGPGGTGSGVVIHAEKSLFKGHILVLTAQHVVRNPDVGGLYVTLFPSEKMYPAEIVKTSAKYDLALLRVDVYHQHVAERGELIELSVFDRIIKIGSGMGEDPFPTLGIIENFEDDTGKMHISAPIVFGDSGGGIFTEENGKYVLVGIVQGTAVAGFKGHPVVVSFMGLCYNIFAINDFLSAE